ncbi:uncharacterized protein PGTG_00648 [Puccinia graminis f. sp. tritici CRL 75-36-700-3]|uniref:Uncharacterized protein n=1 Tax=Puccinia graminis f. sp. tritici (strain CRL 75-36-700-3 / race SCCL) TaxID=418459 RepID=E3JQP3_PUCGT|nr:uncharacterized protein PGTG_00648 [Puccinia graminis f. sp. tritici CRL 75-36-700-3]EFP74692.2 hypothetical protein PGTG_00648 [Puccinia graminis f. sp. tritici CRL 75-36-700-3]
MVAARKSTSNRRDVKPNPPPAARPTSVNGGPDIRSTSKGTMKRSHLCMEALPSVNAESSLKVGPAINKARRVVDANSTIHQGRTPKTAGSHPAVLNANNADKADSISSASLRSMKFKKNPPRGTEKAVKSMMSGSLSRVPASHQNEYATFTKRQPEIKESQKSNQHQDDVLVKKEADTEDDQRPIRDRNPTMVKKEPDTEDNSQELVEMSREQSIIWARAVEADRSGDQVTATALYNRFRALMGYTTMRAIKLPLPNPSPVTVSGRPTSGRTMIGLEKAVSPEMMLFTPFFNQKLKTLKSPIPLTIFNPEWRKAALLYEEKQREEEGDLSSSDEAEGFLTYYGYPYPNEFLQSFREWTLNHMDFHRMLRDVYEFKTFAEWMVLHKANADKIVERHGFMAGLRYDIHVRANAFAYRVQTEEGESMSDISILREDIKEDAFCRSRRFDELRSRDNPYLPGGSRHGYDPISGERITLLPDPHQDEEPTITTIQDRPRKRLSSSDRFAKNPRYKGRSFDPNFIHRNDKRRGRNRSSRSDSRTCP